MQDMIEEQAGISRFFANEPVVFCHNPTAMLNERDVKGYISDLTQATQQKILGVVTDEVNALIDHLVDAVTAVGTTGTVIHIAHSQGALITSLAMRQLSSTEMEQIEVVTFGGAAAIRKTTETPFKRCMNYYSVNDPLLYIVPEAAAALRSGFHASEFCFLAPRIGDPVRDHSLMGPTYQQALQWEGERYQRLYYHPMYRSIRPILLLLKTLLQMIAVLLRIVVIRIGLHCRRVYENTCHMVLVAKNIMDELSTKIKIKEFIQFFVLIFRELVKSMIRLWTGKQEEKFVPIVSTTTGEIPSFPIPPAPTIKSTRKLQPNGKH